MNFTELAVGAGVMLAIVSVLGALVIGYQHNQKNAVAGLGSAAHSQFTNSVQQLHDAVSNFHLQNAFGAAATAIAASASNALAGITSPIGSTVAAPVASPTLTTAAVLPAWPSDTLKASAALPTPTAIGVLAPDESATAWLIRVHPEAIPRAVQWLRFLALAGLPAHVSFADAWLLFSTQTPT